MSALAVTTTVLATLARAGSPDCPRPRTVSHRPAGLVSSCRVERPCSEPAVRLTRRGMAAALAAVALVTGSALVTVVTAFLSVSNLPL